MAENNKYTHRFLARFIIKTETSIAVGSGEKDILTDKLIVRDVNNLPYIPGTAIAGVIRHAIGEDMAKQFFGVPSVDDDNNGKGSEIIFSSAQIIDENKTVVEGLVHEKSNYLQFFDNLPIRQHVSIDDKGVNKTHGKFDEEVVYKGTHFCFEIEMLSDGTNEDLFNNVLDEFMSNSFRIGSGTRNGFGKIAVVECKKAILNLKEKDERIEYLGKTSSLNNNEFWSKYNSYDTTNETQIEDNWLKYEVILKPDDFFLFGSGFGNDKADMTPVMETVINWDWQGNGNPEFQTKYILIPATSIKGAMSHRIAFHYNRLNEYFIRKKEDQYEIDSDARVGVENEAVRALFGYTEEESNVSKRGNVIISDMIQYEVEGVKQKILNHVAIDRFTGGAIDGALFSEEVVYGEGQEYRLEVLVHKNAFEREKVKEAFEATLDDLTSGMLPLGGGTNRGNGCFSGTWNQINVRNHE